MYLTLQCSKPFWRHLIHVFQNGLQLEYGSSESEMGLNLGHFKAYSAFVSNLHVMLLLFTECLRGHCEKILFLRAQVITILCACNKLISSHTCTNAPFLSVYINIRLAPYSATCIYA